MATERENAEAALETADFITQDKTSWIRCVNEPRHSTTVKLNDVTFEARTYAPLDSLPALLAGPTLTPAEVKALDLAMKLMGYCDGSETIAGLLKRTGAATFTVIPEPGDTVRNAYTGRAGYVHMVDGILTHWCPEGSPNNVTSCTAGLEVIKKAPSTPKTGEEGNT